MNYLSLFSGIEAASQTRREDCIRCAKVYLAEAARRRHHSPSNGFFWTLLQWAASARKRAMTAPAQHNLPFMEQAELATGWLYAAGDGTQQAEVRH